MNKKIWRVLFAVICTLSGFSVISVQASASDAADLTQVINPGTLIADIRDENRSPVASPSFALSPVNFSFECGSSTGTIGTNTQRLYVDNPGAADAGWTLTIAATDGPTALWEDSGQTQVFDHNDPTAAGCTDSADADSVGGQLTLNPNAGTLTADCSSCTTANITKGSATSFEEGVVDSITLLNASSASDDAGRWYLTGVGLTQTVPASQAATDYSINLTITATAS